MREAIIHVGTHKTGSTLLQRTLYANRDLLAKRGIGYPDLGPTGGHHVLTTEWIHTLAPAFRPRNSIEAEWKRVHQTPGNTLILSSEEFLRAGPQRVDFRELRERLHSFDRVRVVCFLRHPISFVQSAYLQVISHRNYMGVAAFVQKIIETGCADGLFCDYSELYDHLRSGFAADEISLLSYETARQEEDGLLGSMLRKLDLPVAAEDLKVLPTDRANISPPPLTAWIAYQIATPRPATQSLLDEVGGLLSTVIGRDQKTHLFTRSEAAQLREHFEPIVDRFEARMQAISPEFRLGPTPDVSQCLHRCELPRQIWLQTARYLYRRSA